MGLHELCRDVLHYFDKDFPLEMVEFPGRGFVLYGYCRECEKPRLVYTSELKNPIVIARKMERRE